MTIGQKLKDLRKERTLEEVAGKLNISVSALNMYENDNRVPRDEIKIRICDFYGVSVADLFYERKEQYEEMD